MKTTYAVTGCGYNHLVENEKIQVEKPTVRELDQINQIISFSGLPMTFSVYKANISNAIATIIEDDRFIIYDQRLLDFADKSDVTYWSSMSILAHEIGHHLAGHTLKSKTSPHEAELAADKFSGFALYKMGATLNQAMYAISRLCSEVGSVSHPPKSKRLVAISSGWNEAARQRYKGAIPPPPLDNQADFYEFTTKMLVNEEYIKADDMNIWYREKGYLYGVVTEVDDDWGSMKIHIVRTDKKFTESFRSLNGEEWKVYFDEIEFGGNSEMCHACAFNFKALMIPGRRLKFSMVEAYPDAGTAMNGVWSLSYAKAMPSTAF